MFIGAVVIITRPFKDFVPVFYFDVIIDIVKFIFVIIIRLVGSLLLILLHSDYASDVLCFCHRIWSSFLRIFAAGLNQAYDRRVFLPKRHLHIASNGDFTVVADIGIYCGNPFHFYITNTNISP